MAIILVGFVGPFAGLLLNNSVPFPADFQSPRVYYLTLLNGLMLLIPSFSVQKGSSWFLWGRSLSYPFTFYFFLVFLPFLPLSLLAICAMGLGVLFLVPVVLFFIHTKSLFEDFRASVALRGKTASTVILLAGLFIMPGFIVAEAWFDRGNINKTLDYVYAPDHRTPQRFSGSPQAVARTLLKLKASKEGVQWPYLTAFYNQVVFGGMVLPDSKIDYLYRLFTAEDISRVQEGRPLWARGRVTSFRPRTRGSARVRLPDRRVELVSVNTAVAGSEGAVKTWVRLEMQNGQDNDNAEFVTRLRVPHGVLISGFSLFIGRDKVSAQIFEQKTATWVYHMIRDFVRRDPGLLVYKTPTQIELSVYPFRKGEKRVAEIEFLSPPGFHPTIHIGDRPLRLGGDDIDIKPSPTVVSITGDYPFAIVPSERLRNLPPRTSKTYLTFILDYSKGHENAVGDYARRISEIAGRFPDIEKASIILANFEEQVLTREAGARVLFGIHDADFAAIAPALTKAEFPLRGSLDLSRVIKQQLVPRAYGKEMTGGNQVFVVITAHERNILPLENLEFYKFLMPDNNNNKAFIFSCPKHNEPCQERVKELWPPPVDELEMTVVPLPHPHKKANQPWLHHFPNIEWTKRSGKNPRSQVSMTGPHGKNIFPAHDLSPESTYARGMAKFLENEELLISPAALSRSLSGLVADSRKTGVMIPSTSYIVVERGSQWKILKVKEGQRLRTREGLEFEEDFDTPSPSFWLLLIIFLGWRGWRSQHRFSMPG